MGTAARMSVQAEEYFGKRLYTAEVRVHLAAVEKILLLFSSAAFVSAVKRKNVHWVTIESIADLCDFLEV